MTLFEKIGVWAARGASWATLPHVSSAVFWGVFAGRLIPLIPRMPLDTDPNITAIQGFFNNLTTDLTLFALAMAAFFFALAAIFYMVAGATGNERTRTHAVESLYAALAGLALALLAGAIAALVNAAFPGVSVNKGDGTPVVAPTP